MSGRTHVVSQGESVERLAAREGLRPETIWDHPGNQRLRESGRTVQLLHPGDELFIPARRERVEECAVRARHRLRVATRKARVRVRFVVDDRPRANAAYTLRVDDGPPLTGATDGDGFIEHEVSLFAQHADLTFVEHEDEGAIRLQLSHLNPPTTPTGVQQRLRNLGRYWGPLVDDWDEATRGALAAFQRAEGLPPTGEPTDDTRAALVRAHGS